jgi:hypothetical protein
VGEKRSKLHLEIALRGVPTFKAVSKALIDFEPLEGINMMQLAIEMQCGIKIL